jgi:hypothetical protein
MVVASHTLTIDNNRQQLKNREMPKKLRLLAEYDWFPLYLFEDDEYFDPKELPLSEELIADIDAWKSVFDSILDRSDPWCSGFKSEEEKAIFHQRGLELAGCLQAELGTEYEVYYWNQPVREAAVLW